MKSVLDILYRQIKARSQANALYYLENGDYIPITFYEMAQGAEQLARVLSDQCQSGDKVAIWATNCWQWAITDLAAQLQGLVTVPLYPTAGEDQVSFILNDAKPSIVFVDHCRSDRLAQLKQVKSIHTIVVFYMDSNTVADDFVVGFETFVAQHPAPNLLNAALWQQDRLNDPLTTLYTSGTTGVPKAVPLTHNNIVQNLQAIRDIVPISYTDSSLSFLPLSHIFERTVGYYCFLGVGGSIYYAESIDTVARDLLVAKPSVIISVPRLYEKIYQKVLGNATGLKKMILGLALAIGRGCKRCSLLWNLAYKVVFSKIHQKTGGNVRFLVTGGAPIPKHVEVFFNAIGLPIVQGYGLTETSPIITANLTEKVGSVGKVLSNLEFKVGEDAELLVKGPSVFSGYANVSNDSVFTDDGFFKTGDCGRIDDEGYVYITGRKKEIIVLSNGKNVAPNLVEETLLRSKFISQVVVVGDNRKFLSALIVLDPETVSHVLGIAGTLSDLVENREIKALIQQDVLACSKGLSAYEIIKKFVLIPNEFSIEGMELTPTLKLRRKEINKKYEQKIQSIYMSEGE
jgi:long-chain acyl-CoA synthetase